MASYAQPALGPSRFCPNRGIFAARPEANERKLRSRGGFQAALSPYNMNRQNKYAGKTKTESKP